MGWTVRFVSPGVAAYKAAVAGLLALLAYMTGAAMRGLLRIAINMQEQPPEVLAGADLTLLWYLSLGAFRAQRWVSALATVVIAIGIALVTRAYLSRKSM